MHLVVCDTIAYFNAGAAGKATLLKRLGVKPAPNHLAYVRSKDLSRSPKRCTHARSALKPKQRQKIRAARKTKIDTSLYAEDLHTAPDSYTKKVQEPTKRNRKRKASIHKPTTALKQKSCMPGVTFCQ